MTKRRFKLSLAALGLLLAFFMVLIGLLLAPTLASANKDFGDSHHHGGKPDVVPPQGGSGSASPGSILAGNWIPGHGHGDVPDTGFCSNGIYPCADTGNSHDEDHNAGGYGGDYAGGSHNHDGGGSSGGNGGYPSSFWSAGGNGGGAGGHGGGGGNGGGADGGGGNGGEKTCAKTDDQTGDKADTDKSGNSEKTCDKTDTDDAGDTDDGTDANSTGSTNTNGVGSEFQATFPSDFVDPDFGDGPTGDGPTGDGPNGDPKDGNPPNPAVTEVPEPLTISLFAAGLAGAATLRRRSRRSLPR